jgi:uncharacterized protein YjbI with pentapeptide repeats
MRSRDFVGAAAFVALLSLICILASTQPSRAKATGECERAANTQDWTLGERWVWKRLCAGERADLATAKIDRAIRSEFIVQILTDRNFDDVLPREGVAIAHARFVGPMRLAHHAVDQPLALEYSRFDATLDLSRLASSSNFSLQGSTGGYVDLRYLRAGDVWLKDVVFREIDLSNANISGSVFGNSARVAGRLDFTDATVQGGLDIDSSRLGSFFAPEAQIGFVLSAKRAHVDDWLDLQEASVERQAEFDDATIGGQSALAGLHVVGHLQLPKTAAGKIDLSGSEIGGDLRAGDAKLDELQLARAHLDGQLLLVRTAIRKLDAYGVVVAKDWNVWRSIVSDEATLANSQIGGSVNFDTDAFPSGNLLLSHLSVSGNVNLYAVTAPGSTKLVNLNIGGDLELSGDTFVTLNATGSKISGDLLLAQYEPMHWSDGASLILHNVTVRAIEDRGKCPSVGTCDPLPGKLDLSGFTYEQLGSSAPQPDGQFADDPVARPEKWWQQHWLARQDPFTRDPYDQLSTVLRRFGNEEVADEIMYDGHDVPTRRAPFRNPMLIVQRYVIGYGYNVWLAFPWASVLVLIGTLVLKFSGEGRRLGLPYGVTYSFDMLLPLVRLRESNYKLEPRGLVQYYFYFHKIAGFVLASFLVAALSGLTKQ